MTPNEFTAWLDGFLDGKDSLTAEQIATLRAKAGKLTPLKDINWGTLGGARMVSGGANADPHAYLGKAVA